MGIFNWIEIKQRGIKGKERGGYEIEGAGGIRVL